MNCGFTTFQQCLATVSEAGLCIQNNTYQPPPGPHPQTARSLLAQFLPRRCALAWGWACLVPVRRAASLMEPVTRKPRPMNISQQLRLRRP